MIFCVHTLMLLAWKYELEFSTFLCAALESIWHTYNYHETAPFTRYNEEIDCLKLLSNKRPWFSLTFHIAGKSKTKYQVYRVKMASLGTCFQSVCKENGVIEENSMCASVESLLLCFCKQHWQPLRLLGMASLAEVWSRGYLVGFAATPNFRVIQNHTQYSNRMSRARKLLSFEVLLFSFWLFWGKIILRWYIPQFAWFE